jgi:hypothetical protein
MTSSSRNPGAPSQVQPDSGMRARGAEVTKARYDLSEWPVAIVTILKEEMDTAEFRAHLDKMTSFYERGRLGLVIDVRGENDLKASHRRMVAEWMDEIAAKYPERVACIAIVLSSQLQRGILKAVSWLQRMPVELEAFTDFEAAKKWCYACARTQYVPRRSAR